MNKFVLLVEFDVKPELIESFMPLIDINARASVENEPGCFQFDVMQAIDEPNKIILYEVYENEKAFKVHMEMAHTQTFLTAAKPMIQAQRVLRLDRKVAPKIKQNSENLL